MTLTELKTKLISAATGTDIEQVLFDWVTVLNKEVTKSYPLIFWEIDFVSAIKTIRSVQEQGTFEIRVFGIKQYDPEDDRLAEYDSIMADMDEYLLSVNENTLIEVVPNNISYELWDEAAVSVDRELAVSYTVTLKTWC